VKDVNGDLLADSHNISNRWKNYFSQLLSVLNVSDVRQIEVHTAETLVPGPSRLEVEIAFAKLKKYTEGSDEILAELHQQEVKYFCLQSINLPIAVAARTKARTVFSAPTLYNRFIFLQTKFLNTIYLHAATCKHGVTKLSFRRSAGCDMRITAS
jgi:hypothetical protein